jgi:hypothetical protein
VSAEPAAGPRLTRKQRVYRIDGYRVPSVTTVTGVLDKPALINWAAEQAAAYAVEHWTELESVPIMERAKRISSARHTTTRDAAERGTTLHRMAEQLQAGEATPPPELLGPVQAIADLLDDWELRTWASEAPVGSLEYLYAGTLDTIADSPKLGRVLLDWKTGPRIYSDVTLQLAGYRAADVILRPHVVTGPRGGKSIGYTETDMPAIDACYVAHVLPDTARLIPCRAAGPDLDAFLYARELWEWKRSIDDPKAETYDPPLGEPLVPGEAPGARPW